MPARAKLDDDFAKQLGLQDVEQLRGILRDQQGQELNGLTRTHMKRRLLDELASRHSFQVPESMVDAEYENIMQQLRHEASHEPDPQAALAEIESEATEYRGIAERRVRLGLLLSEIGAANGVEVSQREMNQLIGQAASQYQGKDRERFIQYVQQEPMAAAQLRAPLYEDKVVDFLFSKAEITDRAATRAELEADLEAEEGHVHGPGCGHDVPEAKAKPKKAAAKAKADAPKPEKPAKGAVEEKAEDKPKPAKPLKEGAGSKPAAEKKPAAAKAAEAKKPAAKAEAKKPAARRRQPRRSTACTGLRRNSLHIHTEAGTWLYQDWVPAFAGMTRGTRLAEQNQRVAVLLPCYNEEAAIGATVEGFRKALPDATIYVYDNNSRDRTREVAAAAGAVVRTETQQGKGCVVRRMFADIEADVYLMADGDLTYDPASAPEMVRRLIVREFGHGRRDTAARRVGCLPGRPCPREQAFHAAAGRAVRT